MGGLHGVSSRQINGKPETAANAKHAFNADLAAHELGDVAGNCQSQAGAAVLAGGGSIGLLEGLKDALALFLSQADAGVVDLDAHQHVGALMPHRVNAQNDATLVGEFDGVTHVVKDRLRDAQRIAEQRPQQFGMDVGDDLEAFFLGLRVNYTEDMTTQDVLEHKVDFVELEFPRFNARDIENVIDDREQVA